MDKPLLEYIARNYPDVIVEFPPGEYQFDEPTTISFEGRDMLVIGHVRLEATKPERLITSYNVSTGEMTFTD